MKYKYRNGTLQALKPYDAKEIDSLLLKEGIRASKGRSKGEFILTCDELDAAAKAKAELILSQYDFKNTKPAVSED